MSTYYDFTILAKSKNENWQTLTLQFNKNLLSGWELPVPCTERAPGLDVATVFQTVTTRTRYKFINFYPKEVLFKVGDVADEELTKTLRRYGPIGKSGAVVITLKYLKVLQEKFLHPILNQLRHISQKLFVETIEEPGGLKAMLGKITSIRCKRNTRIE